jgi:hypothetical protein
VLRRLNDTELAAYVSVCRRSVARRAVVVRVPWLARGASGMTIGRVILLERNEPTDGTSALIAHELVHVRQYFELGYLRFTVRYLWAFGRLLARERNHDRAYRAIPFEAEAYAEQRAWVARNST